MGHAALLDVRNDEGFSWFLTGCKETKPIKYLDFHIISLHLLFSYVSTNIET